VCLARVYEYTLVLCEGCTCEVKLKRLVYLNMETSLELVGKLRYTTADICYICPIEYIGFSELTLILFIAARLAEGITRRQSVQGGRLSSDVQISRKLECNCTRNKRRGGNLEDPKNLGLRISAGN